MDKNEIVEFVSNLKIIEHVNKNEILEFVTDLKAGEHVLLLYKRPKERQDVLFTYLNEGLERGEATIYVASEDSPELVKRSMEKFGINVNLYEKDGSMKIIDYRKWYINDGKFYISKVLESWRKWVEETKEGFKGFRIVGETICFFKNRLVKQLVEYENTLGKTFASESAFGTIPLTAICAYNSEALIKAARGFELPLKLLKPHSTAIITGVKAGLIKMT